MTGPATSTAALPTGATRRGRILGAAAGIARTVGSVERLVDLLHAEFGPAELHVLVADSLVPAATGPRTSGVPLALLREAASSRQRSVGDGVLGPSTVLACPVLACGRVVAVVAISCGTGWTASTAALADGVVTLGTPLVLAEQRRILARAVDEGAVPDPWDEEVLHGDAIQVVTAVAERLDLVRAGHRPGHDLALLAVELRRVAGRLAASTSGLGLGLGGDAIVGGCPPGPVSSPATSTAR